MDTHRDRHLKEEELESFLPLERSGEPGATPPDEHRRHLEGCHRCQRELDALRSLHTVLTSLPRLEPSPGFVEAVMARVHLPVPLYVRAWQFLRERWLVVLLSLAGVGLTAGGVAYWILTQPELTLGAMITFTLERVAAFFWGAIMVAARRLWATGLPGLVQSLVRQVSLWQAVGAMAVLSLISTGAAAAMARLLAAPPVRVNAGRS